MKAKPYVRVLSWKPDASKAGNSYPFDIPAILALDTLQFHPDVTFIIGENGTGKSTILEAIALALGFGPEGGTKNVQFQTADTVSNLHNFLRVTKSFVQPKQSYFLRAESFYNVASYMDEIGYLESYGGKSLHKQSHGESFMATILNKFRGPGLFILDEPEAALSPTRQLAALVRIHQLVQEESQFIIATHSPILMAYPSAKIFLLTDKGIREVTYTETEHFCVTRDFLNDYQRQISRLFADN